MAQEFSFEKLMDEALFCFAGKTDIVEYIDMVCDDFDQLDERYSQRKLS